ncbi:MAG: hypothetical protein ACSHXA_02450 [Polaribacter sp.]|uniref:hypothetical protein n=1 Tax=Polaribacter sp. TaxID=1920175 RepID=UPI003EF5AE26
MANNTGKKYGGRKAGTPNKLTKELRISLKNILHEEIEQLPNHFQTLTNKERLELLIKLLPFVLPKVTPVSHKENEPMTFDLFD